MVKGDCPFGWESGAPRAGGDPDELQRRPLEPGRLPAGGESVCITDVQVFRRNWTSRLYGTLPVLSNGDSSCKHHASQPCVDQNTNILAAAPGSWLNSSSSLGLPLVLLKEKKKKAWDVKSWPKATQPGVAKCDVCYGYWVDPFSRSAHSSHQMHLSLHGIKVSLLWS